VVFSGGHRESCLSPRGVNPSASSDWGDERSGPLQLPPKLNYNTSGESWKWGAGAEVVSPLNQYPGQSSSWEVDSKPELCGPKKKAERKKTHKNKHPQNNTKQHKTNKKPQTPTKKQKTKKENPTQEDTRRVLHQNRKDGHLTPRSGQFSSGM